MPARLSPASVARELAKVSEQLRSLEDRHQGGKPDNGSSRPEDLDEGPEPDVAPEPRDIDTSEPLEVATESETEPETDLEPEPVGVIAEREEEREFEEDSDEERSEPAPEATAFGRSRRYKDPKMRHEQPDAGPVGEDTPEPETKDGFSNENLDFGRGKRKNPRR